MIDLSIIQTTWLFILVICLLAIFICRGNRYKFFFWLPVFSASILLALFLLVAFIGTPRAQGPGAPLEGVAFLLMLLIGGVALGMSIWLWYLRSKKESLNRKIVIVSIVFWGLMVPLIGHALPRVLGLYAPFPKGLSQDELRSEYQRRMRLDSQFHRKMPINFYGKVINYTTEESVPKVEVVITWTNLSPTGGSRKVLYTDSQGRFSVTGIRGKRLGVHELKKDGYIRSNAGSQFSFEYAAFFDKHYHQPDSNNPAIFRMKKKGVAEPLVHRQAEITVGVGRGGVVRLDQQTVVQVELLANEGMSAKNWSARVSVPGGGIQTSTEEFPFTAPENGYEPSLILDLETPKPDNWAGMYEGGQFYIKTANGQYGRIELKTVSGKTFMRYSFFLNPSGSQNLEYSPEKILK